MIHRKEKPIFERKLEFSVTMILFCKGDSVTKKRTKQICGDQHIFIYIRNSDCIAVNDATNSEILICYGPDIFIDPAYNSIKFTRFELMDQQTNRFVVIIIYQKCPSFDVPLFLILTL